MLEIKNLSKSYKKHKVLDNVSYHFTPGVYGLLGENGAGKTTLLRCISDIISGDSGEILWKDAPVADNREFQNALAYLPQKFGAIADISVYQMLQFLAVLKEIPKARQEEAIMRALKLTGLSDEAKKKATALSGGMTRRLGIAQMLLGDPELMLFDEATVGLDPEERIRFKSVVSQTKQGRIVIISTHVVEEIESLCDRILVIHAGKLIADMTCEQLKAVAEGHVFELAADRLPSDTPYYMLNEFEQNGERHCRILSMDALQAPPVKPSLEEGYLCLIHS
ncbi:MAG: ATP-binding cassette domain-containing protein [Lachnospiraceae bacterium]|nr:ATP-binding cassette domain-containing protein [Lachnospiraceae bacterium]